MKGNERFYVFYDENDFVEYFGTAKDLVADGYFESPFSVTEKASKIRNGKLKGHVVTLSAEGEIISDRKSNSVL